MNAISQSLTIPKQQTLLILFLIFLFTSENGFSQFQPTPVKRSNNQITVNGKNFYLHEVLKGQTLFGISKEYKVSDEEIKKANPELNQKSVYPGMVLRIPDHGETEAPTVNKVDTRMITHTVWPKETFFSISKKYGVKIEEIKEWNPEVKAGLKTGQIIKIYKGESATAPAIPVVVEKKVSTQTEDPGAIPDNEKHEQSCKVKPFPHVNDRLYLAIMLPLDIEQNDSISYSDTIRPEHFRYYEFLEGVYLAIDSLRLSGLNLTVEVFDTEKNAKTIKRILNDSNIKDADLIIGPVYPSEIEIVAAFAKSHHIPMVSPLSSYNVVKGNPYSFQVRDELNKQIELAINYLGSKYTQNMLVIGRASEKTNSDFVRFLDLLGPAIKNQDPEKKATFKTVYFSETLQNFTNTVSQEVSLDRYLSATAPNFIILESENEVFITEIINKLHDLSTTYNIHVFGLNQWVFDKQDMGNLYNLNLELYTDFDEYAFIDYTDPSVDNFCRTYQANWNIAPSRYSFQGFDVAFYFTTALFQFGRNLTATVPCWDEYIKYRAMLTPMKFKPTRSTDGFDNQAITVIRFQQDELVRKKIN